MHKKFHLESCYLWLAMLVTKNHKHTLLLNKQQEANCKNLNCDYSGTCLYTGHPWDHAKWLLYRDGLLIEVGGALGLY